MQTTQRYRPCRAQSRAQVQPRRPSVRVSAWAGDNTPFAGLLRMFAPARYLNTKDDYPENTGFTGTIPRGRKPYKDGFIVKQPAVAQQCVEAAVIDKFVEGQESPSVLSYLQDATEGAVGHNFNGEEVQPDWFITGHKGNRLNQLTDDIQAMKELFGELWASLME